MEGGNRSGNAGIRRTGKHCGQAVRESNEKTEPKGEFRCGAEQKSQDRGSKQENPEEAKTARQTRSDAWPFRLIRFDLPNKVHYLASQRLNAPAGKISPEEVIGSPISPLVIEPPNFFPTVMDRMLCITVGDSPVV